MFGAPADLANLLAFGIPVLEDAASSLGATYHARPVGGFGAASVFSFGSTKMLTTGQGGMVLVDDSATFERLVGLCDYDGARVDQRGPAYNYQFSDMQAALGLAQLNRLPQFMDRRRTIAGIYRDALGDLPGLRLPAARAGAEHGYYRFVIQVPGNSDKLVRALQQRAIDARSSVAHFLYDYIEASPADFPQCEAVRHSLISLPIYPTLTDEQAQHIGQSCRVAWTERARVSL
jgi:perosamine synthetase